MASAPASAPGPTAPARRVARVHVEVEPLHLDRAFDYLVPDDLEVQLGSRVEVVFAGRRRRAVVVEVVGDTEVPDAQLRPLRAVLGEHAWATAEELEVWRWLAARCGAPLSDVARHALPGRVVAVERAAAERGWYPRARRPSAPPAPTDADLAAAWGPYDAGGGALLDAVADGTGSFLWRPLPGEDLAARVGELVQRCLAGGRDALIVVPDPASPAADGLADRAGDLVVDARDPGGARATYRRWLEARTGHARVVVGTRGVALWPLERLGLAVVVDEANPALKERRSPRHHAREVALERARRAGGVGLLVGTVPSAPAWRLLRQRRLTPVTPTREAERTHRPTITAVPDDGRVRTRLAREATAALGRALDAGTYAVVLAARRGEGTALVCGACGERHACPTCAASLTLGPGQRVSCHACGFGAARLPRCACGERRPVPLAAGAAWLGRELQVTVRAAGHDVPVAVLEGHAVTPPPPPAVLVTTRGSVLDTPPGPVGAVVLGDLDGQLRRPSLDAAEDALRLAFAVASWTVHPRTRAVLPDGGEVVVQSRDRDHHAVADLVSWDPGAFWRAEVPLRAPLRLPPVTTAVRLLLPADEDAGPWRATLPAADGVLGPLPGPEGQTLLITTDDPAATLTALRQAREAASKAGRSVRVDVDPVDAL